MSRQIEQLLDTLEKDKGIIFAKMTKNEAKMKLTNNTNYYKVSCFKKNFKKNINTGKYVNLNFATLYDLSVVDARLRDVFLKMSLDLEHHLKKRFVKIITEAPSIRHKGIFNQFDSYLESIYTGRSPYISIFRKILPVTNDVTHYDYPIYNKYGTGRSLERLKSNLPVWVLMEKMTSGHLVKFLDFYIVKRLANYSYFSNANEFYKNVNKIRNAAAHNRPFLFNINNVAQVGSITRVSSFISDKIKITFNKSSDFTSAIRVVQNQKSHDILSLLYLYDQYVEDTVTKSIRKRALLNVINRTKLNGDLYSNHNELKEMFFTFEKLVKDF